MTTKLPDCSDGHFCNFNFSLISLCEKSNLPSLIFRSDFHSRMIKSTKTLYKWIFKHDRFVLGTRFTVLEDLPRCEIIIRPEMWNNIGILSLSKGFHMIVAFSVLWKQELMASYILKILFAASNPIKHYWRTSNGFSQKRSTSSSQRKFVPFEEVGVQLTSDLLKIL